MLTRRDLLYRAGLALPLFHPRRLFAAQAAAPSAATRPVEFLHLRLRASHMDEQRNFYTKILGLPLAGETRDSFSFRAGRSALEFVAADNGSAPFYHFAFNIPENKLDAAIAWMERRAPLLPRPGTGEHIFHFQLWDAHAIYFADPAGNIVEFIARHTLRNAAPGRFDIPDILCASEIALVTEDVPVLGATLKSEFSIADYIGVSDTFAPVGNEHGLFILMKTGRRMLGLFTAATFPAEVRLRGESRRLAPGGLPYTIEAQS